jgi:Protein of unknown function (DUF4239)
MLFFIREPLWLSGLLLVGLTSTLACLGPLLVRRFVTLEKLTTNNDIAGFKFATVGVLYAVLVAFSIILVWEKFADADNVVQKEAGAAAAMYHLSSGLDAPQDTALRTALTAYLKSVISDEWPAMENGKGSRNTHLALGALYKVVVGIAKAPVSSPIPSEIFNQLDNLTVARRARIGAAEGTVPIIVWLALFIGAVVTIGFTFFFGTKNLRAQMLMTALLSVLIFSELMVAVVLDRPFSGTVKITPDGIADVIADHAGAQ